MERRGNNPEIEHSLKMYFTGDGRTGTPKSFAVGVPAPNHVGHQACGGLHVTDSAAGCASPGCVRVLSKAVMVVGSVTGSVTQSPLTVGLTTEVHTPSSFHAHTLHRRNLAGVEVSA